MAPRAMALPGPSPQYPPPPDVDAQIVLVSRTPGGTIENGGSPFDTKGALGLGGHLDFAAKFKLKKAMPTIPNIFIHYQPMSFYGNKTLPVAVAYGGQTFDVSTPLHSSVTVSMLDIGLFVDLTPLTAATAGILEPEMGAAARLFTFKGVLTGTVGGAANTVVTKDVSVPFPMLYFGLGVYPDPAKHFSLRIDIKSFSNGINTMTEWDMEAAYRPIPVLYLAVGYNAQYIQIDTGGFKADLDFKGPYLAVGVTF